jgi:hypothetical protein
MPPHANVLQWKHIMTDQPLGVVCPNRISMILLINSLILSLFCVIMLLQWSKAHEL